jgi:hypothetical protein
MTDYFREEESYLKFASLQYTLCSTVRTARTAQ